MRALVLMAVVLCVPAAAEERCTIEGKVALVRDGKPAGVAKDRVWVYVENVPDKAWQRKPVTRTMVQEGRTFRPGVMVVVKGDTVEFVNKDKETHSVFAVAGANTFELPPNTDAVTGPKTFEFDGTVPVQCNVHRDMRSSILVVPNPFYSAVDATGRYTLSQLPKGSYRLTAWEPHGGKSTISVKDCAGPRTAKAISLVEQPLATPTHMTGEPFKDEYAPVAELQGN